jgi:hypothetical protein
MVIDTMVVLVTSSGLDPCGIAGDEPIIASRRICPVIESRSGRSRDQSEGGDSVPSLCTRGAQACLCNQVAQTWASVPCSTQEPMPTMTGAWVAVRHGQRPNTNRAWQAFTHTRMLGEHKANVKPSYSATFCGWKDAVENRKDRGRGTRVSCYRS